MQLAKIRTSSGVTWSQAAEPALAERFIGGSWIDTTTPAAMILKTWDGMNWVVQDYVTGVYPQPPIPPVNPVLIDSYGEFNYNQPIPLGLAVTPRTRWGQALTLPTAQNITSVKFYLRKFGSPSEPVTAKIYACSGTPGTNGMGTGSALATTQAITAVSLPSSMSLVEFSFSPAYSASSGGMVIVCAYDGSDDNNYIEIGRDNGTVTHAGNGTYMYNSAWYAQDTSETIFYLYGY